MNVCFKTCVLLLAVGSAQAFMAAPAKMALRASHSPALCRSTLSANRDHASESASPLTKPLAAALAAALLLGGPILPAIAANAPNPYAREEATSSAAAPQKTKAEKDQEKLAIVAVPVVGSLVLAFPFFKRNLERVV
eukprot:CAMPEP_0172188096 /NCGR_PEP_ID=MMETSP1050-20130122/21715_1 /TAXON_ID=233186 /ORGANISM="Cryptomonas curvata, Strain CCAP979/52" /LENGTH=136 /DNA_ID=CAMNT_0012862515 /DNA_START=12 /DNA_END=419 /DNA_ORIENTATION=+